MIGIDLGSRNIKIVQMRQGRMGRFLLFDSIDFYRRFSLAGKKSLTVDFAGLGFDDDQVTATGYGKITIQVEGARQVSEIFAHVEGAVFQSHLEDFTLLDIGGQDSKVIKVRRGQAVDFMTNDRCAASSGRYLENMAAVLGMPLEELVRHSENPEELTSTCAIFGETEIIARIVEGCPNERLAAGVNYSLYKRCAHMLKRLDSEVIVMSGGGALNAALQRIIARETGHRVVILPEPQLNGAIGCCVYREGISNAPDQM